MLECIVVLLHTILLYVMLRSERMRKRCIVDIKEHIALVITYFIRVHACSTLHHIHHYSKYTE